MNRLVSLLILTIGAFILSSAGFAQDKDDIKHALDLAKASYEVEMDKFRKDVEVWFDRREESARKKGDKKTVDVVKTERKRFEEENELPKSLPDDIAKKAAKARDHLETAYKTAIKQYTKEKKDSEAERVEKELTGLRTVAVLGNADRRAARVYESACKLNNANLLKAFDSEINVVKKLAGMKAEQKDMLIEALRTERAAFEDFGAIPFSPRMRSGTLEYIQGSREAAQLAAINFNRIVMQYRKTGNDSAADAAESEKNSLLKPKLWAVWECTGANGGKFTYKLFSDGTAGNPKITWRLEKGKLVIVNRDHPKAPPGGIIDTCAFSESGQKLTAKNQFGFTYSGKLITAR